MKRLQCFKIMKAIFQLLLTYLLCSCITLQSCTIFDDTNPKTELEKLPPATQTGKNTFGCLVNGKAWVTETSVDAWAFYQEGVLSISAQLENNKFDQGISIGLIDNSLQMKEYILSTYPTNFGQLGDFQSNCGYQTSLNHSGKLTITHLDPLNFIISGVFEFEAYSQDCNKVIKITHGRFDLHYAP